MAPRASRPRPPEPGDVTLYIPARNAGRTLLAAIESARNQSVAPAEVVLVLDARSNDSTAAIAEASGLRIVEQADGLLGHARNLALQACRTGWLASVDSDVALAPDWLECLLSAARRPCGGTLAAVGGRTEEALHTPADRWRAVNLPHNWGPLPFDNPFMLVSEMLAQVEIVRAVGGYRADLQAYEDSDLCQRLRHAGFTLRYEPSAVAHHDRRDSVRGVLDLRWKYAAYRQREKLDTLPGLISKLTVNRAYCLQSLSQTLHSEHADVCAISMLLWFHHARRDLQEVLGKWPLMADERREACLRRLHEAATGGLFGEWAGLLEPMRALLSAERCGRKTSSVAGSGAGLPARSAGFDGLSGFESYLSKVGAATRELLAEIPASLAREIIHSARRLSGDLGARFDSLAATRPPEAWSPRRLSEGIERPTWDWSVIAPQVVEALSRDAAPSPRSGPVRLIEPVLAMEQPDAGDAVLADSGLALLPHLESFSDPRRALQQTLESSDVALIGYQTPRAFAPHVPILQPRDLAECCARQGWEIRHFHTEAGLTRLLIRRMRPRMAAVAERRIPQAALACASRFD